MENTNILLTIGIPSYGRPDGLNNLLHSIDFASDQLEVLIIEDYSIDREQISSVVFKFIQTTTLKVRYLENTENFGFDINLKRIIDNSLGKYVCLMGDDDCFVPSRLSEFFLFLQNLRVDIGYILRSYQVLHDYNKVENFIYFTDPLEFPPGPVSVKQLLRRSVVLTGFTINRLYAKKFLDLSYTSSLLYQVWLMAHVTMIHPAINYPFPFVFSKQSWRSGSAAFGTSSNEKSFYTPGNITFENSINFIQSFSYLAKDLDNIYSAGFELSLTSELSKYSYPLLSIQASRGRRNFLRYTNKLEASLPFLKSTYYYHVYKVFLLFFGLRFCDALVRLIKRSIGTPNL